MPSDQPPRDTQATASIARTLRVCAIAAAVILVTWRLSDVVLLIFLAALIAVTLRGVSDWLAERCRLSPHLTLALVSIAVGAFLLGLTYYIGPRLFAQGHDLWQQVTGQLGQLRQQYGDTPFGRMAFKALDNTEATSGEISHVAGTVATSAMGGAVTGIILIVTALYFAISPTMYIAGTLYLFPPAYRPRTRHVLYAVGRTLRWWVLGQSIDMAVVGVLTGIGLSLLGIPLALALSVLAGLFTFVPYFGAIAAAVPAVMVAFTLGWHSVLWTVVLFLITHGIEGYVISPLVQRRTVALPPALTILSMTAFGTLFGPLGLILGTPAAAALLVTVRETYVVAVEDAAPG